MAKKVSKKSSKKITTTTVKLTRELDEAMRDLSTRFGCSKSEIMRDGMYFMLKHAELLNQGYKGLTYHNTDDPKDNITLSFDPYTTGRKI